MMQQLSADLMAQRGSSKFGTCDIKTCSDIDDNESSYALGFHIWNDGQTFTYCIDPLTDKLEQRLTKTSKEM